MGMIVYLVDASGTKIRGLPDPNGGSFDAAGDFDGLPYIPDEALTVWPDIDPCSDTMLGSERMPALLRDIDRMLGHVR